MSKTLCNTLIIVAVIVVSAGLFLGCVAYSRWSAWYSGYGMMGSGTMIGHGYTPINPTMDSKDAMALVA